MCAKHGAPAKRPTAGSELCERLRRVSVSEGSINLAPPFVDVPNRQSRWTVGFNGTSIKGERVLDEDSAPK